MISSTLESPPLDAFQKIGEFFFGGQMWTPQSAENEICERFN
jgi:hypothetical protein